MKQTIPLILAMCFAFAMPVQATEVVGFAPAEYLIGAGSSDAPAMIHEDWKVTTCRCMQPQLEAAELVTSIAKFKTMLRAKMSENRAEFAKLDYEVGWRISNTAT